MIPFLLRRLGLALLAMLGVAILVFALIRLVPGDVVTNLIGLEGNVSAERQAEMRRLFGLDAPLPVQFGRWFAGVARGDLGHSLRTGRDVAGDLAMRFPVTLELAALALLLAVTLAVPLGVVAAVRRGGWPDALASLFALAGLAAPNFWLAILLILLFSLRLRWLPPTGFVALNESPLGNLQHMLLPAVALGLSLAAATARITRSSLLEVLSLDYVRTARAKGLAERVIVYRHAMRNALIPIVTVVGLQVGALLGGAVIVEEIFGLPGVGRYALDGINLRDYPVVQGAVLLVAGAFVLVNVLIDLAYAAADPRVRFE